MPSKQPQRRKPKSLTGSGDYAPSISAIKADLPRLEAKIDHLEKSLVHVTPKVSKAASTIGRTLGNFVNQGDLGALAGEGLSKLFGFGDYSLKSNSLIKDASNLSNMVPKFSSNRRGTRITEREMIATVTSGSLVSGSSQFTNSIYSLNPTNSVAFPWLSTIANQFDQWEPHGIVFEFISTSSEFNGTSQALGVVVMATDYDPYDPPYTSKVQMENADYACATKPSQTLLHGVECDKDERPTPILYTDAHNTSVPLTNYNLGNFQLATQGCSTANATLGELWVSYDITFYKKQITPIIDTLPGLSASGNSVSTTGYLSGTITYAYQDTITITQNVGVGSVINFNNVTLGKFRVVYVRNVTNAADNFGNWVGVGCTLGYQVSGTVPNQITSIVFVTLTAPFATLTTTLVTSTSNYNVSITQVPTTATN